MPPVQIYIKKIYFSNHEIIIFSSSCLAKSQSQKICLEVGSQKAILISTFPIQWKSNRNTMFILLVFSYCLIL